MLPSSPNCFDVVLALLFLAWGCRWLVLLALDADSSAAIAAWAKARGVVVLEQLRCGVLNKPDAGLLGRPVFRVTIMTASGHRLGGFLTGSRIGGNVVHGQWDDIDSSWHIQDQAPHAPIRSPTEPACAAVQSPPFHHHNLRWHAVRQAICLLLLWTALWIGRLALEWTLTLNAVTAVALSASALLATGVVALRFLTRWYRRRMSGEDASSRSPGGTVVWLSNVVPAPSGTHMLAAEGECLRLAFPQQLSTVMFLGSWLAFVLAFVAAVCLSLSAGTLTVASFFMQAVAGLPVYVLIAGASAYAFVYLGWPCYLAVTPATIEVLQAHPWSRRLRTVEAAPLQWAAVCVIPDDRCVLIRYPESRSRPTVILQVSGWSGLRLLQRVYRTLRAMVTQCTP